MLVLAGTVEVRAGARLLRVAAWEHMLVFVEPAPGAGHVRWAAHWPDKRNKKQWLEVLANLGAEGWEVVSTIPVPRSSGGIEGVHFVLKRPTEATS